MGHESPEATSRAELLDQEIVTDELQPLLARLGESEFGGSESSRVRDVVEATGHSLEDVVARLAEVRGVSAEATREKRIAELEARNRLLAADVRRISRHLDESEDKAPKGEHLKEADKVYRVMQTEAYVDRGRDAARLFLLVFGTLAVFGLLLYTSWSLGWW